MVAFASSLDQAGLLARSAEDIALALGSMAGHDPSDSTSADRPVDDYARALQSDVSGMRIGVVTEQFGDGLDPDVGRLVEDAIIALERLGATLVEVSLPNSGLSIPVYYVLAPAEASSNLSRYDGVRFGHRASEPLDMEDLYKRSRSEGFGDEVKRRIMIGTYVLSAGYYDAYYLRAQQLRRLICADFAHAFKQVDLIAGPTSPFTAFPIGDKMDDPVAMYLCDIYTSGINLAGLPALSVPAGFAARSPRRSASHGKSLSRRPASRSRASIPTRYRLAPEIPHAIPLGSARAAKYQLARDRDSDVGSRRGTGDPCTARDQGQDFLWCTDDIRGRAEPTGMRH